MMKKNENLIIHIGSGKAGSSSIQDTLGGAKELLLRNGINFPKFPGNNHILTFPPVFMDDPDNAYVFKKNRYFFENKHLKQQRYKYSWMRKFRRNTSKYYIISAEDLTLPFFTEKAVKKCKKFVGKYFENIRIVVYIRHFKSLIPSHIHQAIKNGGEARTIAQTAKYFMDCPAHISYQENIQKWINVFGKENVIVRPFVKDAFFNNRLIDDFLFAAGIENIELKLQEVRSNPSLGKHATLFLEKYNIKYPVIANGVVNSARGLARQGFPTYLFETYEDTKLDLNLQYSDKQAYKLNDEIDYINQFFDDDTKFDYIESSDEEKVSYIDEHIPVKFFVELINNYHKRIQELQESIGIV